MRLFPPTICLVTDRGRLPNGTDGELVELASAAAAAGVDLIQVRERGLDDRALLALTREILAAVGGTGAVVVVNDRTDVAVAAGAGGVHLRETSAGADRVRAIVEPGFVIGRSVHGADGAVAAARTPVDYLILGAIFPTRSKPPSVSPAGLHELEAACRNVRCPVLAIGGITLGRLEQVAAAGAAGIAAIGLFADVFGAHPRSMRHAKMRELVASVRRAFARGLDGTRIPISAD